MNAAPKKKRPRSYTGAIRVLEAKIAELRISTDYHNNTTRADALQSAVAFLKQVNPVKTRKRRSVAPGAGSNGVVLAATKPPVNGGGE
jgi:hypothetical protein